MKNIKTGVFFSGSIYERTGAGKVVRSFAESKDLFKSYKIEEDIYELSTNNNEVTKSSVIISLGKSIIKTILSKSFWGSKFCIEKLYFKKGDIVLNKYLTYSKQDEDILIFHEIFSCYSYVSYCFANTIEIKKYILILHTNGEVFKMLRIYYPYIVGTKYEKELEQRAEICLNNASKIVFVSEMSQINFSNIYPQFKNKTSVVYNGILPLDKVKRPIFNGCINMVTVGTVNARKNQIILIDCIANLINSYNISLTIVGNGDYLEKCKRKAKELNVEDYIHFLGARDDIPEILSNCNLFVMSSLDEGLPISAIEALRSQLPVVLTDVGGNRELIDNNGYLVTPSSENITKTLIEFSKDIAKQKEMSEKSYQIYQTKFSLSTMIKKYSILIQSLFIN